MNKKAQIGTTMTWFFAMVIIFFVLLIFISSTAFLVGKKKITGNANELNSVGDFGQLETQRELYVALNTLVEVEGEKISLADLYMLVLISEKDYNSEILSFTREIFGNYCEKYSVLTPKGIVVPGNLGYYLGVDPVFEPESPFFPTKYGPVGVIEIPYKDKFFEIKYRKLKTC